MLEHVRQHPLLQGHSLFIGLAINHRRFFWFNDISHSGRRFAAQPVTTGTSAAAVTDGATPTNLLVLIFRPSHTKSSSTPTHQLKRRRSRKWQQTDGTVQRPLNRCHFFGGLRRTLGPLLLLSLSPYRPWRNPNLSPRGWYLPRRTMSRTGWGAIVMVRMRIRRSGSTQMNGLGRGVFHGDWQMFSPGDCGREFI